jgi:hypothetical protein
MTFGEDFMYEPVVGIALETVMYEDEFPLPYSEFVPSQNKTPTYPVEDLTDTLNVPLSRQVDR